jgi:hypothetical protein
MPSSARIAAAFSVAGLLVERRAVSAVCCSSRSASIATIAARADAQRGRFGAVGGRVGAAGGDRGCGCR